MSFRIGDEWTDAPQGSFVLVPAGVTHDFENRSSARAGALNFSIPGGFEDDMPGIAEWFAEHPAAGARRAYVAAPRAAASMTPAAALRLAFRSLAGDDKERVAVGNVRKAVAYPADRFITWGNNDH